MVKLRKKMDTFQKRKKYYGSWLKKIWKFSGIHEGEDVNRQVAIIVQQHLQHKNLHNLLVVIEKRKTIPYMPTCEWYNHWQKPLTMVAVDGWASANFGHIAIYRWHASKEDFWRGSDRTYLCNTRKPWNLCSIIHLERASLNPLASAKSPHFWPTC